MVVGVVAQPHTDAGSGVEPEVLPGPPQRLQPHDGLGAAPPFGGPLQAAPSAADVAAEDGNNELADELVHGAVVQPWRLVSLATGERVVAGDGAGELCLELLADPVRHCGWRRDGLGVGWGFVDTAPLPQLDAAHRRGLIGTEPSAGRSPTT